MMNDPCTCRRKQLVRCNTLSVQLVPRSFFFSDRHEAIKVKFSERKFRRNAISARATGWLSNVDSSCGFSGARIDRQQLSHEAERTF